jgi:hypothetical protein
MNTYIFFHFRSKNLRKIAFQDISSLSPSLPVLKGASQGTWKGQSCVRENEAFCSGFLEPSQGGKPADEVSHEAWSSGELLEAPRQPDYADLSLWL